MTLTTIRRSQAAVYNLYSPFIHPYRKVTPVDYMLGTSGAYLTSVNIRINEVPMYWDRIQIPFTPNDLLHFLNEKTHKDVLTHQLGFIEAVERLFGISDLIENQHSQFKMLIAEIDRIAEHCIWLYELFFNSGLKFLGNHILKIKKMIGTILFLSTGAEHNSLENSINVGVINFDWKVGTKSKLLQLLANTDYEFSKIKSQILMNNLLKELLSVVGLMDLNESIKYGTVGPIAKASGLAYDLRAQDPYWDYLSLDKMKIAISYDLDLYGKVKVILNEISESLSIIRELFISIDQLKPVNVINDFKLDQTGHTSIRIESSDGPTVYNIDCIENMEIKGFGMSGPALTNLYSLERRLIGQPIEHSSRIIQAYNLVQFGISFK